MMTTTATTTAAAPILAIDLGKYKSVVCVFRAADDYRFLSFSTSREQLARLLETHQPAVVLIEACLLAGWVCDLCADPGVRCLVANTTSAAWKFKHLKRKTDKDDALRLAEVYVLGKFPTVAIPGKEVRKQRALIETRQKLVGRRVALQNRLRAVLVGQGLAAPCGAKAWTAHVQALLATAEKKLNELAQANAGVQLLETIPGVGPRTAQAVVAFLPEPQRFRTTKQVSAYGGFVPRQYQSTDTDHRGRITKRGPKTLRKLLVECAWVLLRYNAWARALYQRLTHGGKTRKKQAIGALARKLWVRCWAMLRDGTAWRADPVPAVPTT